MGSRSKQKGAHFEREVCKALSLWITRGRKEDCFWRSAMSGGRATFARKTTGDSLSRQAGDICAVSPEGHVLTDNFYIELKHVKDLQIDRMLEGIGTLWRYWDVAVAEAAHYKRSPMLIAKQNMMPPLVLTEAHDLDMLINQAHNMPHMVLDPAGRVTMPVTEIRLLPDLLLRRFRGTKQ